MLTTTKLTELLKLQNKTWTEEGVALWVRRHCGSLFRLETGGSDQPAASQAPTTLHFIHFSVAEYLRNWKEDTFASLLELDEIKSYISSDVKGKLVLPRSLAHAKILQDCLKYLKSKAFANSLVAIRGNATVKGKLKENKSFFSYTAIRLF